MAITLADWSVSRTTGDIRYIGDDHSGGAPTYATVIEFHRWLQDLADDAASVGDDEIDITDLLPSARSTDNIITLLGIYNIDDATAEHLYDGSIVQADAIYDGIVNFGNADVQIQIQQDGAIIVNDFWNFNGAGLNGDAAQGISHRFMLKTSSAGEDIDTRKLLGSTRTYGNTYAEFAINSTSRGNNVLALSDAPDLNNSTSTVDIAAITDISNLTEGFKQLDINNDTVLESYYSQWDRGFNTINTFYEYCKYITRAGSTEQLYGLDGELFRGITHEILCTNTDTDGFYQEGQPLVWETTIGGTLISSVGQVLAVGTDRVWVQLLKGVSPAINDTLGQIVGGSPILNQVTDLPIDHTAALTKPFIGASTGSAIIGGYGVGIDIGSVTSADRLTDLEDTVINPPNNVTFSVNGLVGGEDRVLIGPWDGMALDLEGNPEIQRDQLQTVTGVLSALDVEFIDVTDPIPLDTPANGQIRILLVSGKYREITYTSWSGSRFYLVPTDFSTDNVAGDSNVWISYLDLLATKSSEGFTCVYAADRDLVVIVRDGGTSPIKQFISSASLTSTGGSITAIRTTDE